jgi:hypothetical protein
VIIAHIAGIPVEELLSFAPVAGVLWLAIRARATGRDERPPAGDGAG